MEDLRFTEGEREQATEPAADTADRTDVATQTDDRATEGQDRRNSPFNLGKIWSDVSSLGNIAAKAALPEGFPALDIFGGGDQAAVQDKKFVPTPQEVATSGREHAQEQADAYLAFRDSRPGKHTPDPDHPSGETRSDGSSYKVDAKGNITNFTSAPTADHPQGRNYEAKYDAQGNLFQLKEEGGLTFTRTTGLSGKGFAGWRATNEQGRMVQYGSRAGDFIGKLALNEDSIQIMIGFDADPSRNTEHAGVLIERSADGSVSRTHRVIEKGRFSGLTSEVTLADGQQVTTRSQWDGKSFKLNEASKVLHDGGDTRTTVKDGQTLEIEENVKAQARMRELALSLDSNQRLQHLRSLDITTGKHGMHVDMQSDAALSGQSAKPGTWADGTLLTGSTTNRHVSFDADYRDGRLHADNIQGMTGHGGRTGPFGRRMFYGSSPVHNIQFSENQMNSRSSRGWTALGGEQLTADMQKFVQKDSLEKVGAMLGMVKENTDRIDVDRLGARSFHLKVDTSDALQAKIKDAGQPLKLEDKVDAKISYKESGVDISDIRGVKLLGQDLKNVKVEPGKNGEYNFKLSLEDPQTRKVSELSFSEARLKQFMATTDVLGPKNNKK